MESTIKWQTGMPSEAGTYIVTKKDWSVKVTNFRQYGAVDEYYFSDCIIAWCKLSDIEPYKDETNK